MPRTILLKTLLSLMVLSILTSCSAASSRLFSSISFVASPTALPTLTFSPTITETETPTPFQPLPTSTLTLTPSITPTFTQTLTPTQVPTDTPTLTPTLPLAHAITDIRGHHQAFSIDCETAAAKDWANYFSKDFNEAEFQYHLPISDNPNYGFVGDVNGPWGQVPPYAYGVYPGPVADLLNTYGVQAKAYSGYTLDQIKAKIAEGVPVIVWIIGNMEGGVPSTYTDSSGRKVVVAAFEHVAIVTGYDQDRIRYMNEGMFYQVPTKVFLNSWGILGNMVVVDK